MKRLLLILFFSSNITWANKGLDCQGYEVLTDKSAVSSKIGIQKGDVIKTFDGVTVTTSQQAMELYSRLDSAGKHEIVVERSGKIEKIKYEIAQAYKPLQ